MGKILVLFVFALCISGTQLKKAKKRWGEQKNSSEVAFPMPRTFKGTPVINIQPFLNGTQTSFLTYSPPALHLLNNSTVGYLGGSLSTRVIPIIYTLVVTVGIPANMCLLVTKIRKVSSAILYCSLAVSDLFLLLSLFFKAHYHFHGNHWVLGETAC
ncbi:proteinase-activated receptor 3-like [Oreochromis aureus]|uniref:proteinase-activated receptor 3-like n=1 Tax=Oreochromis aureus TaxID=47969 RepID=UPI001954463D|nr:proteinase-activated receptor 3-like [Oreochromis aureus]